MTPLLTWIFSIIAAIMLFLHGLASFSEEVARIGGDSLRTRLHKLTHTDLYGALTGAISTALVQSSSAITSMAVGLAHNRTLTDRGAFAVMIGANVGTTLTAWLVAMKIVGLAQYLLRSAAYGRLPALAHGAHMARRCSISG